MKEANEKIPEDEQAKLSDIQEAVWEIEKAASDALLLVRWGEILPENDAMKLLQAAKTERGGQDFTVTTSSTGDDKKLFDDISKTTFGKNGDWLGKNYLKKSVLSYRVGGTQQKPDLDVVFPEFRGAR